MLAVMKILEEVLKGKPDTQKYVFGNTKLFVVNGGLDQLEIQLKKRNLYKLRMYKVIQKKARKFIARIKRIRFLKKKLREMAETKWLMWREEFQEGLVNAA